MTTTNPILNTAPDSGRGSMFTGVMAIVAIVALVAGVVAILGSAANAAPQIGQVAPDFTAQDSKGDSLRLSQYRGKTSCWSGPMPSVRIRASITAAATYKASRSWHSKTASSG